MQRRAQKVEESTGETTQIATLVRTLSVFSGLRSTLQRPMRRQSSRTVCRNALQRASQQPLREKRVLVRAAFEPTGPLYSLGSSFDGLMQADHNASCYERTRPAHYKSQLACSPVLCTLNRLFTPPGDTTLNLSSESDPIPSHSRLAGTMALHACPAHAVRRCKCSISYSSSPSLTRWKVSREQ